MKSKLSLILIIILSVLASVFIAGYVFLKIYTSDRAVKNKIVKTLEGYTGGKLNIENTHFDLFKGLSLDKVKFEGEEPENLRLEAEKVSIKHDPLALLGGELIISSITVISPELFAVREKDTTWKFLNGVKAFLDNAKLKTPTDHLKGGIIVRNTKAHIFDKDMFRKGRLDVENLDLFIQPFGGSLRDIRIKGDINDSFWGNHKIFVDMDFATPGLKLLTQLRNKIMTEDLMRELPVVGEKLWKTYSPTGKFNFDCSLELDNKNNERNMNYNLIVGATDVEVTYTKWPFLVKHVNGALELSKAGIFLKSLKGNVQNEGQEAPGEIDAFFGMGNAKKNINIRVSNFNITEKLMKMFPGIGDKVWVDYNPKGNIDVNITYESNEDKSVTDYSVKAISKDIEARYPNTPYPVSNIVGLIEIDKENVYFKNMSGNLLNGNKINRTTFDGMMDMVNRETKFTVSIPNLDLTEGIIKCIPERGEDIWSKYKPQGQVDLTLNYIGHKDSNKDEYLITVDCKGNEVEYTKLPFEVSNIVGRVVIDKNNIQLKNLQGYIINNKELSRAACNGVIGLRNKNRKLAFSVFDLKVTESLLGKFPELHKKGWFQIEPKGWVDVKFDYESNDLEPEGNYSIIVDTQGCELKLSKYPISITDINARVNIEKEMIVSREFTGIFSGGKANGSIIFDRIPSNEEYMGELRFKEIDLDVLVKNSFKTQHDLSGICDGKIKFYCKGNNLENFVADGNVKIKEGYIVEVPALLSILNLLNLSIPKKETFHSADIKYSVKDKFVNIEELEMLSDTIELGGVGKVGLDGALDLTIVAGFSNEIFSQIPIIGQLMDFVVGGVRKKLTKAHITGTFTKPESSLVALKPFAHPIQSIFDLLSKGGREYKDEGEMNEVEGENTDINLH